LTIISSILHSLLNSPIIFNFSKLEKSITKSPLAKVETKARFSLIFIFL